MWKAAAGQNIPAANNGAADDEDDWDTDPDYVNQMSEHDQRFGAPDRGHVE